MKVQDREICVLPQRTLSCTTTVQHNSVAMHGDIVPPDFLPAFPSVNKDSSDKIFMEVHVQTKVY